MLRALCLLAALLWSASLALGVEGPALEVGRTLFEATTLGSNGNSCATCHPGGKGLAEVGAYDDATLKEMINFCIRDALKGTMFSPEAQELEALLRYVRNLVDR
jgi:cytochrome c